MPVIATAESPALTADLPPLSLAPPGVVREPRSRRDMALFILAAIAIVFALKWTQSFVVSLLLGILFAYTLNRLVIWLELIRIPRAAGTRIVMLAAGLPHLIPYVGPVVTTVVIGIAAFMQFDTLSMMLLLGGASLLIATVVGYFVTTWMTGRIAKMNPVAVFVSLLFWAWLWGVWGMLLSVPIIVIDNVVAQHMEQFSAVAELLSD